MDIQAPFYTRFTNLVLLELWKPLDSLENAFAQFAKTEVDLWGRHSQSKSEDFLVKISGSLRSSLAYRPNQHSETTLCPRNGEVADETNPCIAMIMGNAFEKGHTLIYDQILRRDQDSDGVEKYPKDVVQCHENFIQDIREPSEAKVEVICGKIVRKRLMRDDRFKFDILPL